MTATGIDPTDISRIYLIRVQITSSVDFNLVGLQTLLDLLPGFPKIMLKILIHNSTTRRKVEENLFTSPITNTDNPVGHSVLLFLSICNNSYE